MQRLGKEIKTLLSPFLWINVTHPGPDCQTAAKQTIDGLSGLHYCYFCYCKPYIVFFVLSLLTLFLPPSFIEPATPQITQRGQGSRGRKARRQKPRSPVKGVHLPRREGSVKHNNARLS